MGDRKFESVLAALAAVCLIAGTTHAGSITGRVTRDTDGAPIEGVSISARAYGFGFGTKYACTDSWGLYTIADLVEGAYRVQAETPDWEYVRQYYDQTYSEDDATLVEVIAAEETLGIDFVLTRGGSISGRVTRDSDGAPLQGITVMAGDDEMAILTYTDEAGFYFIEHLHPGAFIVAARDENYGYLEESYDNMRWPEGTPVIVIANEETSGVDISLALGGSISGKVTRLSDGTPLEGILIQVNYYEDGYLDRRTNTDAGGNYTVTGLGASNYIVSAYDGDGGYLHAFYDNALPWDKASPVAVALGQDTAGIDFALTLGGSISGRVTRELDGSPVEGATVEAFWWENHILHCGETRTDGNGSYLIDGLHAGAYLVSADGTELLQEYYDDTYVWWDSTTAVVVTDEQDTPGINFALATYGSIAGRVTRELDGGPVEGVCIIVEALDGWHNSGDRACTDDMGNYVFDGLYAGAYHVRVEALFTPYPDEWYDGAYSRDHAIVVEVAGGLQTSSIDFSLTEGNTLSGTVTDKWTDQPLESVRVECWNKDLEFGRIGWTAPGGEYELTGLLPGTLIVRAAPTWTMPYACIGREVYLSDDLSGFNFALPRGATLSGRVVDAETAEGVHSFSLEYWNEIYNMGFNYWMGGDGSFTLTNLPPGLARLNPGTPNFGIESSHADLIYMEEGEQVSGRVISLQRGVRVWGLVKDLAGQPAISAAVYFARHDYERETVTDAWGSYHLDLPPGKYMAGVDFHADDNGDAQWASLPVNVTISDADYVQAPDIIAYSRDTGGQISGTASNSGGWGIRTPRIAAMEAGTVMTPETFALVREVCSAVPLEMGEFVIPILPPGSYDLYLVAEYRDVDGIGSLVVCDKVLNVPVGTTDAVLHAVLPEGGLGGTVRNAAGRPVLGATVFVADAGGVYVGSAKTGAGGVYAISNLPDGRYTLGVMHLKYRTVEAVVDVVEGGTTQVGTLVMAFAGGKEASDLNGDGVTDAGDLAVLAEQWLAAGDVEANFDQQGAVDLADLARMADLWRWEAMWTLTGSGL